MLERERTKINPEDTEQVIQEFFESIRQRVAKAMKKEGLGTLHQVAKLASVPKPSMYRIINQHAGMQCYPSLKNIARITAWCDKVLK